jgi:Coenzyme PQQ synthesis protein D (PqqD)
MELTDSYEPAGQDIVSEEIDGEVIIVNLKNGHYYSLTQSATVIWAGIQEHAPLEQIQDRLLARYSGDTASIRQGLVDLIKALEVEQLITQRSAAAEEASPVDESTAGEIPLGEKEAYLPPLFERFTDMGDLLLLDPVHEVEDEKGWPHAKRNG